jgi:hypothetical protein
MRKIIKKIFLLLFIVLSIVYPLSISKSNTEYRHALKIYEQNINNLIDDEFLIKEEKNIDKSLIKKRRILDNKKSHLLNTYDNLLKLEKMIGKIDSDKIIKTIEKIDEDNNPVITNKKNDIKEKIYLYEKNKHLGKDVKTITLYEKKSNKKITKNKTEEEIINNKEEKEIINSKEENKIENVEDKKDKNTKPLLEKENIEITKQYPSNSITIDNTSYPIVVGGQERVDLFLNEFVNYGYYIGQTYNDGGIEYKTHNDGLSLWLAADKLGIGKLMYNINSIIFTDINGISKEYNFIGITEETLWGGQIAPDDIWEAMMGRGGDYIIIQTCDPDSNGNAKAHGYYFQIKS